MDLLSKNPVDEPNIDDLDPLGLFKLMNDSGKRQAWERNHPGKRAYEPEVWEQEEKDFQNGTGYYAFDQDDEQEF